MAARLSATGPGALGRRTSDRVAALIQHVQSVSVSVVLPITLAAHSAQFLEPGIWRSAARDARRGLLPRHWPQSFTAT